MFADLATFLESGRALQAGRYDSLYPLPLALLFALLGNVPLPLAGLILGGASVVALIGLTGRRAIAWAVYVPILETLYLGQLSLVWLACWRIATPLSLAVLTLKPQLAIVCIPPTLLARRELIRPWLVWCAVLYLPSIVWRPTWPAEWLQRIAAGADGRIGAGTGAALWGSGWLIPALVIGAMLVWRRWALVWALHPGLRAYDFSLLVGARRGATGLVVLSWIAWLVMQALQASWPMAVLGLYWGCAGRLGVIQ